MCTYLYQSWSTRGQQRHRAVPRRCARVVHEPVRHLHLGVLEPDGNRAVVVIQRTFPDAPRAREVLLALFPHFAYFTQTLSFQYTRRIEVLVLLAFLQAVLGELLHVRDLQRGRLEILLLVLLRLAHDLLREDLRTPGAIRDQGVVVETTVDGSASVDHRGRGDSLEARKREISKRREEKCSARGGAGTYLRGSRRLVLHASGTRVLHRRRTLTQLGAQRALAEVTHRARETGRRRRRPWIWPRTAFF